MCREIQQTLSRTILIRNFFTQTWSRELATKESWKNSQKNYFIKPKSFFRDAFAASSRYQVCLKKILDLDGRRACLQGLPVCGKSI